MKHGLAALWGAGSLLFERCKSKCFELVRKVRCVDDSAAELGLSRPFERLLGRRSKISTRQRRGLKSSGNLSGDVLLLLFAVCYHLIDSKSSLQYCNVFDNNFQTISVHQIF